MQGERTRETLPPPTHLYRQLTKAWKGAFEHPQSCEDLQTLNNCGHLMIMEN